MEKISINNIKDRDHINGVFLVKEKITAMAKNGKPYLTIRLMDKTGEVDAKVWDDADYVSTLFNKNDFLDIEAKASVYLGKMQLIISDLKRVDESEVVLSDFLPETSGNIGEMKQELKILLESIENVWLKRLLDSFFSDKEFMERYSTAPAAKGMHHVYLGGLLEHSLSVARLVDAIVPLYAGLDRDLIVTGALLHDLGKIKEMTYTRSFDYTDEGKLIGHITIGLEMISRKIADIQDFPPELSMLLRHMIISHHGQYEYGSPKRPKTVEATILSYLDDLDSKINGIRSHIKKGGDMQGHWTPYHRLYDRYFYIPEGQTDHVNEIEVVEDVVEEPLQGRQSGMKSEAVSERFSNNPFAELGGAGDKKNKEPGLF
ncbi:MAG: HD domain-containing protein [Desulfuromonadales bacterium]|nr:HD domain-containing protein [Desulfuromonadales bacterium]